MQPGPGVTLGDLLAPLTARKWFILFAVVFTTVGTFVYFDREPESYEATTKLFIAQESDPALGVSGGFSDARTVANQAQLLKSREVAESVKELTGYSGDAGALSGAVRAVSSEDTDFITITATGRTAQEAQAIANGYARAFIDLRSERRREQLNKTLSALEAQRKQIPVSPETAASREEISSRIRSLRVAGSTAPGNAQQVDAAGPGGLTSESPKRQALFALVLTLLASSALAYTATRFDNRIATAEDAGKAYRRPVLGTVGREKDIVHFDGGQPAVVGSAREAFRGLRVNLRLAALSEPVRVILVTSANPGEGKSTLVRNLALTLHEAGQRVAVVDADLRKPSLAGLFGVQPGPGLTDVLTGDVSLDDATLTVLAPSTPPAASADDDDHDTTGRGLTLLNAGHEPANPPAVLESNDLRDLLRALGEQHDYVLIDTPPVLSVSDAIPLMGAVDAVVIPARIGTTTRRAAQAASELIARVPGVNFIGIVANDLETGTPGYYGSTAYAQPPATTA